MEYLGLDCNARNFRIVGIYCDDPKKYTQISYAKSQLHLMYSNNCILIICADEMNTIEKLESEMRAISGGAYVLLGAPVDQACLISQSLQIIVSRLQSIPEAPEDEFVLLQNLSASHINKSFLSLIKYVNAHYKEDLVLQQLADDFNINYSYCSDLFKKATGTNFSQYLTNLRINNACNLLRESDTGIAQIAYETGYNDYHYFALVFKKATGVTPSQYREHNSED